ncbi:MAG: hypothetical protein KJ000_27465 [Pirellulaceae bacterium]|nr:hypothetical protein [Pirellulaceae bacterium]
MKTSPRTNPERSGRLRSRFDLSGSRLTILCRRIDPMRCFLLLWLIGRTVGCVFLAGMAIQQPVAGDQVGQAAGEFPAELRREEPVAEIDRAVVFTVNEFTRSEAELALARSVGSDVLIRGWFKWREAPAVQSMVEIPRQAHQIGALFGGGITCSALYDGENGIPREHLLDMATRGPDGRLIDAWGQPGIRHGSLSSPAYRDYLFRWCREQIDAGVDYLFMDEIDAALGPQEGFDDHSLADFLRWLREESAETKGWADDDARWTTLGVDLSNPAIAADGTMRTFDYRGYLRAGQWLGDPHSAANPLAAHWAQFRRHRDDRVWRGLTDRIRSYAAEKQRKVYLSGNGIVPYVDLQVLGVWDRWAVRDGRIDLGESQVPAWRAVVQRGRQVAGRAVPVVLFHDWGFGNPPFPWLAVPPADRAIWMRTRGAEIYAAGGFFAFPVLGPFGCNAARDGTLGEIQRQTVFYQRNRDLYLDSDFLGSETLRTEDEDLSLAVGWHSERRSVLLHVINRRVRDGQLEPRQAAQVWLPLSVAPDAPVQGTSPGGQASEPVPYSVVVSPDWPGERKARVEQRDGGLLVTLPEFEAYAVAELSYREPPELGPLRDPARIRPELRWARPVRRDFRVLPGAVVEDSLNLNGFLQGGLHPHLRNPPVFEVDAPNGGRLSVRVNSVAQWGARLQYSVDGEVRRVIDLPDRDGTNDANVAEYGTVYELPIPAGRHRLTVENVGRDWLTLDWYTFEGEFRVPGSDGQ